MFEWLLEHLVDAVDPGIMLSVRSKMDVTPPKSMLRVLARLPKSATAGTCAIAFSSYQ